jgi:hypothetical protein
MTYDHLLAQGERLIEILEPKPEAENDDTETESGWWSNDSGWWPNDDIPF